MTETRSRPVLVGWCLTLAGLAVAVVRGRAGGADVVRDAEAVRRLYDRTAPLYDVAVAAYRPFGAHRLADRAIDGLRLQPGDTVVDLGSGTGRNLPALAAAVGSEGRVVAVDLSPGMLRRARRRVQRLELDQVEFVVGDIADHRLPAGTRAVMASFAMEMVPSYHREIARLVQELPPGGRLALTGLRDPQRWPEWLIRLGSAINRPFGVSRAYRSHRPWEAVEATTTDYAYEEILCGSVYLALGSAPTGMGGAPLADDRGTSPVG